MKNSRYLFRGKKLNGGDWVIGQPLTCDSEMFIVGDLEEACEEYCSPKYWYAVNHETVEHCTGMHDKTRKLVFEGDICKDDQGGLFEIKFINNQHFYGLVMEYFPDGELMHLEDFSPVWNEVIGNIHDNPELLKN